MQCGVRFSNEPAFTNVCIEGDDEKKGFVQSGFFAIYSYTIQLQHSTIFVEYSSLYLKLICSLLSLDDVSRSLFILFWHN